MRENVTDDPVDSVPRVESLDPPDTHGFDALFDRYYERAVRLAFVTGAGNQAGAQDIASEALARVWIKWQARTVDDFWPYLRVAVVNGARSAARRVRVAERHERSQPEPSPFANAESAIVERDVIAAALERLPVRQRTVLVLRYFEDLSYEECARVMHCRVGTAKSTTARALVALRGVLEGQSHD